jgi:ABC-2 type transport system permease protein
MGNWVNWTFATAKLDLMEFLTYRMAVISTVLTSFVMVAAFGLGARQNQMTIEGMSYIVFILPGILAMGTMYSCIYSAGYTIILDRQRRLIDDLVLSPIAYSSFVVGRLVSNLLKSSLQFTVTISIAVLLIKVPVEEPAVLLLSFLLTAIMIGAIGMILGSMSNILSISGLINVVTLPFTYFCGVFFPVRYFKQLSPVIEWVPFTSSIELFRYGLIQKTLVGSFSSNLLNLVFFATVFLAASIMAFRRSVLRRG